MNSDPAGTQRDILKIKVGLLILASYSLIVSFLPLPYFWGLESLQTFPIALRVTIFVFLATSMLPHVSGRLGSGIAAKLGGFTNRQHLTLYTAVSLVLLLLFIMLSSRNHLLGDGYLVMGNLASGTRGSAFEPLTHLLTTSLYQLIGGGETGALWIYRSIAYASGVALFCALWIHERDKALLTLLIAGLLCFGAIQFFFGYVENYTPGFLFVFLYLLAATRDLERQTTSASTLVFLLLAIGFSLSSGVLVPSYLYLLHNRYRSKSLLIIMLVGAGCLLIGALFYAQSNVTISSVFLSPVRSPGSPYFLFSPKHFLDLFNLLMLVYPLAVVTQLSDAAWRLPHGRFHMLTVGAAVLFTITVDPKLGAVRDWDLLSLAAAPLMVATIVLLRSLAKSDSRQAFRLLVPLVLFAVLHTGSWVVLNHSQLKSYAFVRGAVSQDPHYSAEFDKGFRNVSWAWTISTKLQDHDEAIRRLQVRLRGEPNDFDSRFMLAKLYSEHKGDDTAAVNVISGHWRGLLSDPAAISEIGILLVRCNRLDEAAEMFEAFIAGGGQRYQVFYNYAVIKEVQGDFNAAWEFYSKALQLNPDVPSVQKLNFYLFCLRHGRVNQGLEGMNSAMPNLPDHVRSIATDLLAAVRQQDTTAIDSIGRILIRRVQ
jgi:tetratricopeptide (TPR) repeat protein